MAWNDNGDQGPWGKKKPSSSGNQDVPDIDDILRQGQENIRRMMGGGSGGQGSGMNGRFLGLIAIAGLMLWAATGFYRVKEGERAVILRFGEINRTTDPGLRYHIPAPFERALVVPVTKTRILQSGSMSVSAEAFALRGENVQDLMITGDENLVKIKFTVQWYVKDIADFLFNDPRPDETVNFAAESAVREVLAQTTLINALTTGKAKIIADSKKMLQNLLDEYKVGILVDKINLEEVNPPPSVIDSFRDVQRARADLESKVNEAKAYQNSIIPVARGSGQKLVQSAEADKQAVIQLAQGETARFISVLRAYQKAPDVTLTRLRIENSEEILKGVPKYIISGERSQGVLPYLPIKQLNAQSEGK